MLVTLLGIIVLLHPTNNVFDDFSIIALQLSRESYLILPDSTTMDVKLPQPEKTSSPIDVTPLGMITEVKQ